VRVWLGLVMCCVRIGSVCVCVVWNTMSVDREFALF
jgi:hypothetical protein